MFALAKNFLICLFKSLSLLCLETITSKYLQLFTIGIFMSARKNQGLVHLMVLGLKHTEKDLLPLYNKECSVEYV